MAEPTRDGYVGARITYTMRRALEAIADGTVVYRSRWGAFSGVALGTFDALERRGLAEIDYSRESDGRVPVVLTDLGRAAINEARP